MEKFLVDPVDCLILKALRDSSSLREAAGLLDCDPAGLTRRIQQISSETGFVQKINNRWHVTARGLDLIAWAEESIENQKKIVSSKHSLRIASTMWFSEVVIIPNLNSLKEIIGENTSLSFSVPNKSFELALIDASVDFIINCHAPENPEIEHKKIHPEEWSVVAPAKWAESFKNKYESDIIQELSNRPFIRHADMNPDLFMPWLENITESGLIFDNLISVRCSVLEGYGWSLAPSVLIQRDLREGRLIRIPCDINTLDRHVCLWWLRSREPMKRQAAKISGWVKQACLSQD